MNNKHKAREKMRENKRKDMNRKENESPTIQGFRGILRGGEKLPQHKNQTKKNTIKKSKKWQTKLNQQGIEK